MFRQDGFTFDAGPTILTAPFLLEELWTLCGRSMADDVTLTAGHPVLPHPLSRRLHASTAPATPTPCAPRSPGCHLAMSPATSASCGSAKPPAASASSNLATCRSASITDMAPGRAGPDPPRRLPQRLCPGQQVHQGRAPAHRLQLPSAADRRQPVHRQRHLHPDPVSGAALGRAFRHGRHRRRWCAGWSSLIEGQGGTHPLATPRWSRSWSHSGRATRRAAGIRRDDRRRHRGVQRRFRLDLPQAAAARSRAGAGPIASWSGRATRWACSSGISAPTGATTMSPTTPSSSVRATANCCSDIFKRKVLAEDFSLYLHRPTATDPSLAPPGCDAFYVLSPVPNLGRRDRLANSRRTLPAGHRGAPVGDRAAGPGAARRDLAD